MEEKTLKELIAELVGLGMPEEQAKKLQSKEVATAIIDTLKVNKPVEKVKTLEEIESPTEKRAFESQWVSKATIMKERLLSQPKVKILLPLEGEEKQGVVEMRTNKHGETYQQLISGACETVILNGFKWIIPKGVYAEVPQQVADVIAKSYQQTQMAGSNISMDRVDEKTGRLMKDIL